MMEITNKTGVNTMLVKFIAVIVALVFLIFVVAGSGILYTKEYIGIECFSVLNIWAGMYYHKMVR